VLIPWQITEYSFVGDLLENDHVEAETCRRYIVKGRLIVVDCAVLG
jgi:hypothetical protein